MSGTTQSDFTETLGEISILMQEEVKLRALPHPTPEQQARLAAIPGLIEALDARAIALQQAGEGA